MRKAGFSRVVCPIPAVSPSGAHDACGECPSCRTFTHFVHPDLHFVFPIIKYKTAESSVCDVYLDAWRKRLQAGLYFDLNDWLGDMKAENQQALIYAAEAAQIQRKLALKSTLGGRKAMIVWMPEKNECGMCQQVAQTHRRTAPEQTNFLLVSDEPEKILPTILSRTQQIEVRASTTKVWWKPSAKPIPRRTWKLSHAMPEAAIPQH